MDGNLENGKAVYEAFLGGDMDRLKTLFAEDAEWYASDQLPLGGTVKGRDKIIGDFGQMGEYWTDFELTPEEFIDGGDWVVVRGTQKGAGKSGSFECRFSHLMRFEDGKLVRGEFFNDTALAKQAL